MSENNGTVEGRLSKVMAAVGRIDKSGRAPAAMGGFHYVPVTAVMAALQPALVEQGIILLPRVELLRLDEYQTAQSHAHVWLATVHVQLYASDGVKELLWSEGVGQGADTQDKAVGKATSSAIKQAILNALAVPTGDDIEATAIDGRSTGARSAPRRRTEAGTTAPASSARARMIGRINELLERIEALDSKEVNRWSIRQHVRKTYERDHLSAFFKSATDEQVKELGTYLHAKLEEAEQARTVAARPHNLIEGGSGAMTLDRASGNDPHKTSHTFEGQGKTAGAPSAEPPTGGTDHE